MLEKAVDVCRKNKVRWIKADASQTIAKMSQEIIEQARKYTTQLPDPHKESDALDQLVDMTRMLCINT